MKGRFPRKAKDLHANIRYLDNDTKDELAELLEEQGF